MALKIRVTCVFIDFSSPQITWSGASEPPSPPFCFDCFLPSLTEAGVTAIRFRLHLFCSNHTPPCQLQFHQLMFPAIVLPVTNCLQSRGEEMELWPTACLDLHIQLPTALCGLGASQVSLSPKMYFRVPYLHRGANIPVLAHCSHAAPRACL